MQRSKITLLLAAALLSACAMTQSPVAVSNSGSTETAVSPEPRYEPITPSAKTPAATAPVVPVAVKAQPELALSRLPVLAQLRHKNPAGLQAYAGQTLTGQAKFVKTAKGNPNAAVADVQVKGLGGVSLWCRNLLGSALSSQPVKFDGVLTGDVYTDEDFSRDVYLKDCRFR